MYPITDAKRMATSGILNGDIVFGYGFFFFADGDCGSSFFSSLSLRVCFGVGGIRSSESVLFEERVMGSVEDFPCEYQSLKSPFYAQNSKKELIYFHQMSTNKEILS